jgi:hypothetical protein
VKIAVCIDDSISSDPLSPYPLSPLQDRALAQPSASGVGNLIEDYECEALVISVVSSQANGTTSHLSAWSMCGGSE